MNPPSSPPIINNWISSKFYLARTICIVVISTSSILSAGPLDDYLNNPPHVVNPPWGFVDPPSVTIPIYLKEFSEAKTDEDKARPIGQLVFLALQMSNVPELRPAVAELLEKHIMPNLDHTKVLHKTNAFSWHHSILYCKQTYGRLGDHEAVRRCLNTFHQGSPLVEDKEMALYLLAYHDAGLGNYNEAIATINLLPSESKWANHRPTLIEGWKNMQTKAEEKAKKAEQRAKQKKQKN